MNPAGDHEAQFIQVDGLRLCYYEIGDGFPLIALHGGGPGASALSNFSRNIEALSASNRLILLDLPGYGGSDKPRIEQPLNSYYAGIIAHFMDALHINRASLLGNSLGGGAAIKLAIDAPDRVENLILLGPGGGLAVNSAVGPSEGIRALVRFYEGDGPSLEKFRTFLDLMVFDGSELTDELVAERYAAATAPGVAENFPLRLSNMKFPYEPLWPFLSKVKARTLIVWGRDDRTNTIDNAYIMTNQIADVRLHIFGRCGHWVQWEKSEDFNILVSKFLEKQIPLST